MKAPNQSFYEEIHDKYWKSNSDDSEAKSLFSDRIEKSKSLITPMKARKVLNVGFESVKVAAYLVSDFELEEYILVDIDENLCRIPDELSTKGYRSINMDVSAQNIPFDDDYFDVVYAGEIIEHLWNPDFVLREMYRVTKVGGSVIITTPNLSSWYNRILLLIGLTPINIELSSEVIIGRRFKFLGNGSPPVGHIRVYTKQGLTELLKKESISKYKLLGYKRGDVRFDCIFSHFPSLATGIIIDIKKAPS